MMVYWTYSEIVGVWEQIHKVRSIRGGRNSLRVVSFSSQRLCSTEFFYLLCSREAA